MTTHSRDREIDRRTTPAVAGAAVGLRSGALLLLLILLTGLNITGLTQGWLGSVPYHGHIFLGGHGNIPHSHAGDALARTSGAIGGPAGTEELSDARVISLRAFAVVELVSGVVGFAAIASSPALPFPPGFSRAYPAPVTIRGDGERVGPAPPPPRNS